MEIDRNITNIPVEIFLYALVWLYVISALACVFGNYVFIAKTLYVIFTLYYFSLFAASIKEMIFFGAKIMETLHKCTYVVASCLLMQYFVWGVILNQLFMFITAFYLNIFGTIALILYHRICDGIK